MEEKKTMGYGKLSLIGAPNTHAAGAVLEIDKGKQTDMSFHRLHGKIVYVLSGKIRASVINAGRVSSIEVLAGQSFFVRAGLVNQITALEDSVVVEFAEHSEMYIDSMCVSKGTQLPAPPVTSDTVEPGEFAKMTEEDAAKVEPKTIKKTTRKKRTTKKKKVTKKATRKTRKK